MLRPGTFIASALVTSLLLALSGCKDSGSAKTIAQPAATPAGEPAPNKHAKTVWPPVSADASQNGFVAEDLLRRNFYVVLDGSGSMADKGCSGNRSKFKAAVDALLDFSQSIPAGDNLGLLVFDGNGISERLPLGINNRPQFQSVLSASRPAHGTPLKTAIDKGLKALTRQASSQLGYGEYHMVIVTDGEASSGEDPTSVVNWVIDNTAITIHTIGFCIDTRHSLNQPGRTLYSAVDDTAGLERELKAVLAEAETFDSGAFK